MKQRSRIGLSIGIAACCVIAPFVIADESVYVPGNDGVTNPIQTRHGDIGDPRILGTHTVSVGADAIIGVEGEAGSIEMTICEVAASNGKVVKEGHRKKTCKAAGDSITSYLKSSRWDPATLDGKPVAVYHTVALTFDGPK